MTQFVNEVLASEYNHSTDITFLAGDFNIDRNPLKPSFAKCLTDSNVKFGPLVEELNNEFENVLLKSFKQNLPDYTAIDVVDQSGQGKSFVTYGDSYIDNKGQEKPLDTVLTYHLEFCSKQCLDHVFLLHKKDATQNDKVQLLKNSV